MKKIVVSTLCLVSCLVTGLNAEERAWSEFSVMLKPSSVGNGVGIFATHDIAAGARVFAGKISPKKAQTKDIPPEFIKYVVFLDDETCLCPERFDRMEMGWFINHSFDPNVTKTEDGCFAVRAIKAGEEFFMDYNQLNEPEHLKEAYYIKQ